jgi:anti-anti-sigma factor
MSRFSIEREGPKVKVMVATDLTAEVVPELRGLLCAIQDDGVTDLALDLSGTKALDATGISLLVATANSYRDGNKHLTLRSVPRSIFSLLQSLRIAQRLGAQTE